MSRIYGRRISTNGAVKRYHVTITNPEGNEIEIEVVEEVFDALDGLQRDMWRMQRSDDRHIRHAEMILEQELPDFFFEKSAEDIFIEKSETEKLKSTLRQLSDRQLRRFLLHDMLGYPIKQIAQIEGCSERAIDHSLSLARKNLRKLFSE